MATQSVAHSFRRAVRGTAFAVAASAALLSAGLPTKADAADFSQEQCKAISAVAGAVVRTVGREKLSLEFRQSFRNFLGANLTCDGPKDIATPWEEDIAVLGTIADLLAAPPARISLQKAGLRSVDPKVAAREQKHTELANPQLRPGG